jgi:hypothetical protein
MLPQFRAACAAIDRLDDEIGKLAPALPDYALFRALPGAALAPRLLVAFGERRERFPDACPLRRVSLPASPAAAPSAAPEVAASLPT